VEVRVERDADADAVGGVLQRSFGHEAAAIVEVLARLRAVDDLRTALVAEDDGEVVGYVALSRAWLDARERLVDILVLSPLGVLAERQGEGIGTALLTAAVTEARAAGAPLVFLEGSPTFYGDRGWERASAHGLEPPSARIPDAACQVVLLDAHEPWMIGRLVYPDAWWRLDLVGLRDPLLAEVERG
jgi:putative acetyltransferase